MIVRKAAGRAVFTDARMGKATLCRGGQVFAGLNCFLPGQQHELHSHAGQDKLYFVLEGTGEVTVGGLTERMEPGDLVMAESGQPHGIVNPGPGCLVVLTVMAPPPQSKPSGSPPRA